jgi:hypothetical protein
MKVNSFLVVKGLAAPGAMKLDKPQTQSGHCGETKIHCLYQELNSDNSE